MSLPTVAELTPISLYNTLRRGIFPVEFRAPGKATLYYCGPTTYDVAHVGHARSAIAFDLLVRILRRHALEVTYARNITDIDDRILAKAQATHEEPTALAARMAELYLQDVEALGCGVPTYQPRVSDHLPQIIALIQRLIELNHAYVIAREGQGSDVYYRVRSFAEYGKLSGRSLDDLRAGKRIEVNERKEDPFDFALWKGCSNQEWGWSSPWGQGRPGWHIECSAMSEAYLGHGFDIHGGGMDLIFPHHENEIAQSEAAHPGEGLMAACWVHNGFVNIDSAKLKAQLEKISTETSTLEKMSKSLGNVITIREVLQCNDAEALRLFLLSYHYRGPIDLELEVRESKRRFPKIDEAERALDYFYTTWVRVEALPECTEVTPSKEWIEIEQRVQQMHLNALNALSEDLNTVSVISIVHAMATLLNELLDRVARRKQDLALFAPLIKKSFLAFRDITTTLGILGVTPEIYFQRTRMRRIVVRGLNESEIETQIAKRNEARRLKDFASADTLRAELTALGIELLDSPTGTTWRIQV